jgi:hypothetical protein
MAPWIKLPEQVRLLILESLLEDDCSVAKFATVSREWQAVIEQRNFARIKLTTSRLTSFGSMVHRNRHLMSYIWLYVELRLYSSHDACTPQNCRSWLFEDVEYVATAIWKLLLTLSTWEPCGELVLDISVYSPSDSEHLLKYLIFEPDTYLDDRLGPGSADLGERAGHNWSLRNAIGEAKWHIITIFNITSHVNIDFDVIIARICDDNFWEELPLVTAVTGVLLRQQTCRQLLLNGLANIFVCFPRL